MQEESKRPCSQPLHEQLSPPAGIHPLSTPPSSLTTPLPLKKKKLLKVILKSPPTPNPNRLSPSLSSSPSSPPPPPPPLSPSSLSSPSLLPPHHHHLQQHQLHHHQQLLLQQQHLHKQKLLQQQTQQLASELQLKLHQQHLLQQEHPKLLEQFKQQLEQEQICASSSDLQGNSQQSTGSGSWDRRRNLKGQSPQQEISEFQEKGRFTQEERRNASSGRRRARSGDFSCVALAEEQFVLQKSRFHSEGEASLGHILQANAHTPLDEFCSNGQEEPSLQMQENIYGEPSSKWLKISEQQIEENHDVLNPLRSPAGQRNNVQIPGYNGLLHTQKPLSNGVLSSPRLANSSSAAILDPSDTKRLHIAGNSTASHVSHSLAKPVSEGIRHKDGSATGPSAKTLGGSGNASVPGRKVLRGILDKLQKKDSYGAFSEPVDANEVPDYYDVIKEPMDFGTMRKRISAGFYTSLELFEKDIFAICRNAMTFNATGTVYHRQARAIKVAAERILDPLKTPGSGGVGEGVLKQKAGLPPVKKSHKKKQPWKPWTSDYISEPLATNLDGRGTGRAPTSYLADSYYVDWQAGIGQTSSKMNIDDKDDAMGYLAKSQSLGVNDGRRFFLNEESRRGTYKPVSNSGSGSLVNTVGGCPLQFVPAAFQLDFSYARSLARFAADLGPDVWKVAGEKIRRALPMGVPFGPGWVGQREAPARAFSLTNKSAAPCSMDSQGKAENMPNDGVFATADVQRVGNSCVVSGASGAPESKGMTILSDQNSLAIDRTVNQRYVEELRPSELSHFSQAAPQVPLEDDTRKAQSLLSCDGDQGVRQRESSYYSQASCRGCVGEIDLPNCEGDVVLIPGRDLDGRGCLDFKNTQPSALHLNAGSVALIEGIQPRLNEDG